MHKHSQRLRGLQMTSSYRIFLTAPTRLLVLTALHCTALHYIQNNVLGHPIVGDVKYGAPQAFKTKDIALHAYALTVAHPITSVEVKWAGTFVLLFNSLQKLQKQQWSSSHYLTFWFYCLSLFSSRICLKYKLLRLHCFYQLNHIFDAVAARINIYKFFLRLRSDYHTSSLPSPLFR